MSPLGVGTKRAYQLGREDTPKGVAGAHSSGVDVKIERYA